MVVEIGRSSETFATNGTLVRFLAAMDPTVRVQRARRGEPFATDVAHVRFLTCRSARKYQKGCAQAIGSLRVHLCACGCVVSAAKAGRRSCHTPDTVVGLVRELFERLPFCGRRRLVALLPSFRRRTRRPRPSGSSPKVALE